MRISDLMTENMIFFNVPGVNRTEVITNIIQEMAKQTSEIKNVEKFIIEVLDREKLGSTGIGDEVAIPHARTELVDRILIAFARTEKKISFESIDNLPVQFVFIIAVPIRELKIYLTTLANISRLVKNKTIRQMLLSAKSAKELLDTIRNIEDELNL